MFTWGFSLLLLQPTWLKIISRRSRALLIKNDVYSLLFGPWEMWQWFQRTIVKRVINNSSLGTHCEMAQVMAWCRQATSHYLSQCWPRSTSPYGIASSQWIKWSFPELPPGKCLFLCMVALPLGLILMILFNTLRPKQSALHTTSSKVFLEKNNVDLKFFALKGLIGIKLVLVKKRVWWCQTYKLLLDPVFTQI